MLPPYAKSLRLAETGPEPLSLALAKQYCRVTTTDDDTLIGGLITAARREAEQRTNQSYLLTQWKLVLDYFPGDGFAYGGPFGGCNNQNYTASTIVLPWSPVAGVQSIAYVDQGGVIQTVSPQAVNVSIGTPGRIATAYGSYFPFTLPQIAAVEITYQAGYSIPPPSAIAAIGLLTRYLYQSTTASDPGPEPAAIETLLSTTRSYMYG